MRDPTRVAFSTGLRQRLWVALNGLNEASPRVWVQNKKCFQLQMR